MNEKEFFLIKEKVWGFLVPAIQRVIESYTVFSSKEVSEDAKEFSNHHAASKSALAHLESLLKIIKNSPFKEDEREGEVVDLSRLIEDAKKSLEQTHQEE